MGPKVGAHLWESCPTLGLLLGIVSANEKALLAQLLSVKEVDLARFETFPIKCVLNDDEVTVVQAV